MLNILVLGLHQLTQIFPGLSTNQGEFRPSYTGCYTPSIHSILEVEKGIQLDFLPFSGQGRFPQLPDPYTCYSLCLALLPSLPAISACTPSSAFPLLGLLPLHSLGPQAAAALFTSLPLLDWTLGLV